MKEKMDCIRKRSTTGCLSKIKPNRKWGVIIAVAFCHVVVATPFGLGVLYYGLLVYYNESRKLTAVILSLAAGLSFIPGVLVSVFVSRFGTRPTIIAGSIILLISSILSFFATGITYLIFSFGALLGIGICMIQVSAKVAMAQTFDKHHDLAMSIVYLGGNVGGIVILQLHAVWIPEYGVPGCILLTGAFLFHACAAGATLSPMKCTRPANDSQEDFCKNAANWTIKFHDLLRNPLFRIWLTIIIICMGTISTILVTFVDHVTSLGYSETTGALLISLNEFIGIPFRIFYGWVSDKSGKYKFHLAIASFAITGLASLLFGLIHTEIGLYTLLVIFGCAKSTAVTSISIVTKHLSDESNREQAFGLVSTTMGIAIVVSGPFIGWLRDMTGSYRWPYILSGVLPLFVCLLALVLITVLRIRENRTTAYSINN